MKQDDFAHLHLHSHFSILDGACKIKPLVNAVKEKGMSAVALTDHGVMYGTIDFYKACLEAGVKPIIGCEAYITTGSRHDRGAASGQHKTHHVVLLAKDSTGLLNLGRLTSKAHLEGFYYKPRIDKELLAEYSEGLIGTSACLRGEVATRLREDDVDGAVVVANEYADILGKDNFYLEIADHGIDDQRRVNGHMRAVAERTGLPIIASNDVHYLEQSDAPAHEVLLCLQTATVMSDPRRLKYGSDQFFLKGRAEMDAIFPDFPDAVERTLEVADRCNVEIAFDELHFPTFDTPDNIDQKKYLVDLCVEGIQRLYNIAQPLKPKSESEKTIFERLKMEMAIIERTGFINYFLVVWDFVAYAHRNHIPVGPGRGSGGGSLVAYALGITAIDPIRYGLIFERFLNPERVSAPDFDIDFCQARRGEVIEYVKDKYGRDSVAQIITFGTLGAKTVIRDVGRVLEVAYADCDRLSKMIPDDPKMTLRKAMEQNPEFKKAYDSEAVCKQILDYGFVLEGLCRNPGTHAAGVVIGEKPLIEIIPLTRDKDNKEIVTQYTMEPCGEIGLLKMDFLGLRTLTVIQEAVDLAKRFHDVDIDLVNLPLDDPPTYELLNRGDTVGVFQLESGGMRDLIRRITIDRIEDLTAMIALYRPGPMNMLDDYVARKTGRQTIKYDHPLLESILNETHGVMLYQEQVQKAANVLAGYSLGEADILRRAMGKKKAEVMEEQRAKFVAGCQETNQIPAAKAGSIFDTIAQFAGYGFNKSHSAGYAIVSYQTAFMKANYPPEFMAALISSEIGNFDKIPIFVAEASEMGLKILSPDVNASGVRFVPEGGDGLRYGLAGIKGVGTGAAEAIVAEREANGIFADLVELVSRVESQNVNKKALESLVRAGACDCFSMHRGRLFEGIEFAMSRASEIIDDRASGQGSLFDLMEPDAAGAQAANELPPAEEWAESILLAAEKELLGVYLSGHPLTQFEHTLSAYSMTTLDKLGDCDDKSLTRVGGIISTMTRRLTKQDPPRPMAILLVEDLAGTAEVVVYPDTYEDYGANLAPEAPVLVCAEVDRQEEPAKLKAREIYPLADAARVFCTRLSVHVSAVAVTDEQLTTIREALRQHPGQTPVTICLIYATGEKVFIDTDPMLRVNPTEELVHALQRVTGENTVFTAVNPNACRRPARKRQFVGQRG